MQSHGRFDVPNGPVVVARTTAWIAALTGVVMLCAWAFDVAPLLRMRPGLISMPPMTAIVTGLIGSALLLRCLRQAHALARPTACGLALVGAAIGAIRCTEVATDVSYGVGAFLIPREQMGFGAATNGMSPLAAVCALLAGPAVALLDARTRGGRWPSQPLAVLSGYVALLGLLDFAYGIGFFEAHSASGLMSVQTAVVFVLLSIGILCARPDLSIVGVLFSSVPEERPFRRLFISAILAVPIIGAIRILGTRWGLFDAEFGAAVAVVCLMAIMGLLVSHAARSLRRALVRRNQAEDEARVHQWLEKVTRQHADALEAANAELARRNAELDEFSYMASHDLQEPLRKLQSFSQLLPIDLGGDLSPKAATDLRYISEAAARMQNLIQDLLALSRAGRSEMRREAVPLDACVDAALEALDVKLKETGATLTRDRLPTVSGDATLLAQLFQNLIGNALKFTRPDQKPVLHLSAQQAGTAWVIGVRDNGLGIKPEYAESIFAPFKRLHGKGEFPGTGIGLAICRKVAERHGGRIWVESQPGSGSHFKFTLQASEESTACVPDRARPASSSSSKMIPATRS